MDKELIERLTIEAGIPVGLTNHSAAGVVVRRWDATPEQLAKFAALVAEECAKEAEKQDYEWSCSACSAAKNSAAAIRAKFSTN